jgi:hypothetical protein
MVRHLLAALLVITALCSPAIAEQYKDGDDMAPPPERFVHEYTKGTLHTLEVPPGRVRRLCAQLFAKHKKWKWLRGGPPYLGCAVPGEKECQIIFGYGDHNTFIHEVAHCNGWSDRHER